MPVWRDVCHDTFSNLGRFQFLKPSVSRKVVIEAGQMATLILHPQFPETPQSRVSDVTPLQPARDHDAKEHSTIAFQIASAQRTKFVIF